ncbi:MULTISPECIES: damage-control phosphatase ARMT1 family protein [unclassified Lebetimonas]|uniref:damage-control phosphatase ARMT1 family protein n=1 Tax=unclassified Lebetimonas TaxID=2648158 RepID=UPI000463DD47|nr:MULTISPECIES: ARMT1-like domain-containing protein [unclassified Lebetimonas]
MKIKRDCYVCIYNQALNVTKRLNLDENKASDILRGVALILSKYDLSFTPPDIAKEVYEYIRKKLNINDPFKKEKEISIKEALNFKPLLEEKLKNSKNPLFDACKIAIAGNIIDLGVNQEYDLNKEIENIFNMNFIHNDFNKLENKLKKAKTLCYLADNAGENVFDEILIKVIKKIYPKIKVYYLVRGKPIINDITVNDLKGSEISNFAEIIDTGVDTPGFSLKYANSKSKEIFYNADLVISKGMGNFEVLFGECGREVFYLFKVKCGVVANACGCEKGDNVILKGNK